MDFEIFGKGVPNVGLMLLLATGAYASTRGANPIPTGLPDPSSGQINGKVALTVAPQELGKSNILLPWGYVAHLTGYDDPDVEFEFPCGAWSQPPRGRYRVWVEGEWQISPFTHVIRFSPLPFHGSGLVTSAAVVPAGRVALPSGFVQHENLVLRLLHAGSYLEEGYPRWELSRRKRVRDVGQGLLMPAGLTVGALWDEQSQSYVALSRPFEVQPRQTVVAPLERPSSGRTHFVAQIQRASLAHDAADAMKVALYRQGKRLEPDLRVSLADRTYSIWYELTPGPAELQAEARDALLQPQQINLQAGRIERRLDEMTLQPNWAAGPRR